MSVITEVIIPIATCAIGAAIPIAYTAVKKKKARPAKVEHALAELARKLDTMIESYAEGAAKNKMSQRTLFTVQDRQFKVMRAQTGAIRELAKTVCNGNKASALELCDQADAMCANGEDIQKDYLIQR